ncbi:MAG: glycosyltransferase family 1 protein [Pseudomonadota bacterium]
MKIGIDISILKHGGGVGSYIDHLLKGYKNSRIQHQYSLFFNSFRTNYKINVDPLFNVKSFRIPDLILKYFWIYLTYPPIEYFIGPVDVFHSPAHSPIYSYCPPAKKWVVTIHDLFTFKLNYGKNTKALELKVLKILDKKANRIIAVSHSTRNDLIELVPGLESRTIVIHEGVDEKYFYAERSELISKKYGIRTPYILYVGAGDYHKNLIRLIKVYKRISYIFPHFLVIVGKITDRHRVLRVLVKELNLSQKVIFTGIVNEDNLPAVYKGADLFVLPSIYEGFGLVLPEAMACGIPIIASRNSSIPEVVGNAGVFFNPFHEDNMYDVCLTVLSNHELRRRMQFLSIKQARKFSWQKMVERTLEIYEEV